jgi:tetratricopeptide (TPR) repeat protein
LTIGSSALVNVAQSKALARSLAAKGRFEKAEVLYRQVLTRVPRDASVWVRHAEVLKRLGHGEKAAWSYRTAASILVALGYEARAIACLRLALQFKPDDIDLVSELIRVEMHRAEHKAHARPAPPPPPLASLEEPQLALPMLTEVDPRASGDSVIVRLEPPAPPPPRAAPHAPAPQAVVPIEVELPVARQHWPQVRRISDLEVAIKANPASEWIVLTSGSPIEVRFSETLAIDEVTTFVG